MQCRPQHTASHGNTLQHAVATCITLQHTATHCNALQRTATHCNALQHTATHCNTLQHTATHCNSYFRSRCQHSINVRNRALTKDNGWYNFSKIISVIILYSNFRRELSIENCYLPVPCGPLNEHTATHSAILCNTHCNTLQYTAAHCSTIHHAAAHCQTLHHTATHCNTYG